MKHLIITAIAIMVLCGSAYADDKWSDDITASSDITVYSSDATNSGEVFVGEWHQLTAKEEGMDAASVFVIVLFSVLVSCFTVACLVASFKDRTINELKNTAVLLGYAHYSHNEDDSVSSRKFNWVKP